ncbi:MAG: acetylxylan esterase [Fimbriimonadales bacterium]|nr:acetylxylan esterase [Fimbriimonadales bacterium]
MSEFLQPYVPEDFDEFWEEAISEAKEVPLDFRRGRENVSSLQGFWVEEITFLGMGERWLRGWMAYPLVREGRLSAFLWVPPYGRSSSLPDVFTTREGFASMSFNLIGEGAFHQEEYEISRGYYALGAEDPRRWIYRRIYQDCWLAVRVLRVQIEVDEDRLGAMGLSQGGGIALALGALSPYLKVVCGDLPFLSAMRYILSQGVHRYPLKELLDYAMELPLGMERIKNTLSYYDTLNFATRVKVPAQVSLGLRDPACPPETVRAVYEALRVPKRLMEYEGGHDWDLRMVSYNREWMMMNF